MKYKFSMRGILFCMLHLFFLNTDLLSQQRFTLTGHVPIEYNGSIISLTSYDGSFKQLVTIAKDGEFYIVGDSDSEYDFVSLTVTKNSTVVFGSDFFIAPTEMRIEIPPMGNKLSDKLGFINIPFIEEQAQYDSLVKPVRDSLGAAINLLKFFRIQKTSSLRVDSLQNIVDILRKRELNMKLLFVNLTSDVYIGLYQFKQDIISNIYIHPDSLMNIFLNFSYNLKESKLGKSLYREILKKQTLTIGKVAPDFSFSSNTGQQFVLSSFRDTNYVLLCFWDSWCTPCIKSFPMLNKIYQLYAKRGLKIISLSMDKSEEKWRESLRKYKLPWIQTCDIPAYVKHGSIKELYDIRAIPQYFLLDREGKLVYHNLQLLDDDNYTILQEKIAEFLK